MDWRVDTGLERMKREISKMKTGENIFVMVIMSILFEQQKQQKPADRKTHNVGGKTAQ